MHQYRPAMASGHQGYYNKIVESLVATVPSSATLLGTSRLTQSPAHCCFVYCVGHGVVRDSEDEAPNSNDSNDDNEGKSVSVTCQYIKVAYLHVMEDTR